MFLHIAIGLIHVPILSGKNTSCDVFSRTSGKYEGFQKPISVSYTDTHTHEPRDIKQLHLHLYLPNPDIMEGFVSIITSLKGTNYFCQPLLFLARKDIIRHSRRNRVMAAL